jgi:hypothetical protein
MGHKFSIGQVVVFTPDAGDALQTAVRVKITRLLPIEGSQYQYHVQTESDGLERRARESQLHSA